MSKEIQFQDDQSNGLSNKSGAILEKNKSMSVLLSKKSTLIAKDIKDIRSKIGWGVERLVTKSD